MLDRLIRAIAAVGGAVIERTLIRPPSSQLGPIEAAERAALMQGSAMAGKYDKPMDRASAFEILRDRAAKAAAEAEEAEAQAEAAETPALREFNNARRYAGKGVTRSTSKPKGRSMGESLGGAVASVVIKELKGTTGRRIVRGILGGLFKGR